MKAVKNTYEDTIFRVYFCTDDVKDFTNRGCRYYLDTLTRKEVLSLLYSSQELSFRYKDKKRLKILINPKLLLSTDSIAENQIYHTMPKGEYHHIFWKASPHYEVYFRIDHDKKIIIFLLGSFKKTLEIREQTRYIWKLIGERVYCNTTEELEQTLLNSPNNRFGVDLGRRALNIHSKIYPMQDITYAGISIQEEKIKYDTGYK